MAPQFGTSGLRGLVSALTPELVTDHTRAFLSACPHGGTVYVGWDLRPSSPAIAGVVIEAVRSAGVRTVELGALPTPALALASMTAGAAAIMVTGSHIPADRNGLKFYTPAGEITKQDEAAIVGALGQDWPDTAPPGEVVRETQAGARYIARYVAAFGASALAGLRIGVHEHSSVARDMLTEALEALGATVVPLARSDVFVPVDTEAVDPAMRAQLAGWCATHALEALVSTDGDADRPMVADASGRIVPGDVLGTLTARALGAQVICTPISSNSMIERMEEFVAIRRTRIGSPHVIAAMQAALAEDPHARVVGYEANGGFLLGFRADGPTGPLAPLATRDAFLPIIAPLAAARAAGKSLADLAAALPPVFTAADRVEGVPTETSQAFIAALARDVAARETFFEAGADEVALDHTDGLRLSFSNGAVVHLRPSGNAPECRCYAEADSPESARALVTVHLEKLRSWLGGQGPAFIQ